MREETMVRAPGLSARPKPTLTVESTINRLHAKLAEPPVIVTVAQGSGRI
jgi:hypothetical protein